LASVKVSHVSAAEAAAAGKGREKTRLIAGNGPKVAVGVKIGGDFTLQKNAPFLKDRSATFDKIKARRDEEFKAAVPEPISVTLPDGKVFEGTAWATTPMDVALSISKGLAQNSLVAKVMYSSRAKPFFVGEVCQDDGMGDEMDDDLLANSDR
jgi:threonyl-tRNA synthetase